MKNLIFIIAFLTSISSFSQENNIKHFEISVSALFWTPTSTHMKATNSLMSIIPPDSYTSSDADVIGYGSCIAPKIQTNYFFKNYLGLSFGLNYLSIQNYLEFTDASTPITGETNKFHNEAKILNLQLGYAGQTNDYARIHIYYGAGVNYTPYYSLKHNTEINTNEFPSYSAEAWAIGAYINAGMQIKIFPFIYFTMGLEYSYIPHTLKYTSFGATDHEEKTDLGGIAGQIGLSFKFLNY